MRKLLGPDSIPAGDLDDDAVADAYPWPEQGRWVRAMMVTSLDGAAAGPDGTSGSITGDADQQVFNGVRRFADAVLVGAGTIRAEGYGPMKAKPADAGRREAAGQRPAPVLAIVSGSLSLDWDADLFGESTETPILLTGSGVDADALATAREHADVVVLDDEEVTAGAAIATLEARGLRRIVCEGGPTLLESVVAEGLLDEADITLAPVFGGIGGGPDDGPLADVVGLHLHHLLHGDGYLMGRYLRDGEAAGEQPA